MSISLHEPRPLEPDPLLYTPRDETAEKIEELEERIDEVRREALEELEARLDSYNAALALYEARIASLEAFKTGAALVGSWKASTCIYREGEICKLWRLTPEAAKKLQEVTARDSDGTARINVAKAPWFCALCPLYRQQGATR